MIFINLTGSGILLFPGQFIFFFCQDIQHAFQLTDPFQLAFQAFIGIGNGLHIIIQFFQVGYFFLQLLALKIGFP